MGVPADQRVGWHELGHAGVEPEAVVVEVSDADLAHAAVLAARRPLEVVGFPQV